MWAAENPLQYLFFKEENSTSVVLFDRVRNQCYLYRTTEPGKQKGTGVPKTEGQRRASCVVRMVQDLVKIIVFNTVSDCIQICRQI